MPSPRVRTTTAVNPGLLRRRRKEYLMSRTGGGSQGSSCYSGSSSSTAGKLPRLIRPSPKVKARYLRSCGWFTVGLLTNFQFPGVRMLRRRYGVARSVAALIGLVVWSTSRVGAQVTTAELRGNVLGPGRTTLPGASVEVEHERPASSVAPLPARTGLIGFSGWSPARMTSRCARWAIGRSAIQVSS